MEQMKVGIIGAGGIAENMAKTLDGMDDAAAYAIAARNLDSDALTVAVSDYDSYIFSCVKRPCAVYRHAFCNAL